MAEIERIQRKTVEENKEKELNSIAAGEPDHPKVKTQEGSPAEPEAKERKKEPGIKAGIWLVGWLAVVGVLLVGIFLMVHHVDPFMHYHAPYTEEYFYKLDNERSQNPGIIAHFDYDTMVTGTSMVQNFKTSLVDQKFGGSSIKICFSGATFKEINDNVRYALEQQPKLTRVIRSMDMNMLLDPPDKLRKDLGIYPFYLYDGNPLTDVKYIFNKDVIFRSAEMISAADYSKKYRGITSFDKYARWQDWNKFGPGRVIGKGLKPVPETEQLPMTEEERKNLEENITRNVTSLAGEHPEVQFYYFIPPYSAVWWERTIREGKLQVRLEAERFLIEECLKYDNIHLFSFNNCTDITTELNFYKDTTHYGEWISDWMVKQMKAERYRLTKENYQEYRKREESFYSTFDYTSMNGQTDLEDDRQAAELLKDE